LFKTTIKPLNRNCENKYFTVLLRVSRVSLKLLSDKAHAAHVHGNKVTQASGPTKLRFVIYTEKSKANLPGLKQWWQ
jgi:hypothetical protein